MTATPKRAIWLYKATQLPHPSAISGFPDKGKSHSKVLERTIAKSQILSLINTLFRSYGIKKALLLSRGWDGNRTLFLPSCEP